MGEDEDAEVEDEYGPIEKRCRSCGEGGSIGEMVDCSRFEEDMEEKGVDPGWIHSSCCEEEFLSDPRGCTECCGSDQIVINVQSHFEKCVNLEGLTKSIDKNGIPIFASEPDYYIITAEADKLLEPHKPLNIVADTFSDTEEEILYVKDNHSNVTAYSLDLFKEIEKRFSLISSFEPEMFCISNGPLCIVYGIGEASYGAMLANQNGHRGLDVHRIGLDIAIKSKAQYSRAEQFFDIVINPDREKLKAKIQSFSEDEFIRVVLVPILCAQGFKSVKPVSFHGPGESGGDFHPFYKIEDFGKIVYYSAQAKAVKIHANAGIREGNVNQLINQMDELFRTTFKSFSDNTQRKITRAFIFSSKDIAPDARTQLFFEYENGQYVTLVEIDDIVTAALENGIADQVFNYSRKEGLTISK